MTVRWWLRSRRWVGRPCSWTQIWLRWRTKFFPSQHKNGSSSSKRPKPPASSSNNPTSPKHKKPSSSQVAWKTCYRQRSRIWMSQCWGRRGRRRACCLSIIRRCGGVLIVGCCWIRCGVCRCCRGWGRLFSRRMKWAKCHRCHKQQGRG